MAEKTQPTDAEILDAADYFRSQYTHGGTTFDEFDALDFARAVLAKWGSPVVAGEPVAWIPPERDGEYHSSLTITAYRQPMAGWEPVYRHTPQPTQAQAGAVPLTCEWTHNDDDGFWETACGEAWRFDDGGPGENNMHFCHSCGNSLRIKGGQHGTE